MRVPRLFLPRNGFEKWACPPCDRHAGERDFWERVARKVGDAPSALNCLFPDALIGGEDVPAGEVLSERMYSLLETGGIERLYRGMVLVERETPYGMRRGIVACVDLEEFSEEADRDMLIRASEETDRRITEARLTARRGALLEFPHTVLLYRDKRDKLMRSFEDEELERLYEFDLPAGGGKIAGYYLPAYIAEDVALELVSHADPCFVAADGNHSLLAAKRYWEELQRKLPVAGQRNHPARFHLVEFVNAADETLCFSPLHRKLSGIETEAFCGFFSRKVKCRREGNVLLPTLSGADGYQRAEGAISEFLRENGGEKTLFSGDPAKFSREEETAVVAMPEIGAEDLLSTAKSGKLFPAKSFLFGGEDGGRYCLEGREISYD